MKSLLELLSSLSLKKRRAGGPQLNTKRRKEKSKPQRAAPIHQFSRFSGRRIDWIGCPSLTAQPVLLGEPFNQPKPIHDWFHSQIKDLFISSTHSSWFCWFHSLSLGNSFIELLSSIHIPLLLSLPVNSIQLISQLISFIVSLIFIESTNAPLKLPPVMLLYHSCC